MGVDLVTCVLYTKAVARFALAGLSCFMVMPQYSALCVCYILWLFCNRQLLTSLENCGSDPAQVADCFVRLNEGFVVYSDYCTNYPRYTVD